MSPDDAPQDSEQENEDSTPEEPSGEDTAAGESPDEPQEEEIEPDQEPEQENEELTPEELSREVTEGGESADEPQEEEIEPDQPPPEASDETSIKDVLQREAERSEDEEPSEEEIEEEQLPGDYLTADELPEREEFTFPDWAKKAGWWGLGITLVFLLFWYLILPGIEMVLTSQIQRNFADEDYPSAGFYFRIGYIGGGIPVKYPDKFAGDYFTGLIRAGKHELFKREYNNLVGRNPGPFTVKARAEHLVSTGQWKKLKNLARNLNQYPSTRGIGFLLATRAYLQLGNLSEARSTLEHAWSERRSDASYDRLERDLALKEQDYEKAAEKSRALFEKLNPAVETKNWHRWNRHDRRLADDYFLRGEAWFEQGRKEAALRMYERALDIEPNHRPARARLIRRYTIDQRWSSVRNYVEGGGRWKAHSQIFPLDSLGWWTAGEIKHKYSQTTGQAIPLVQRSLALNPREAESSRILGEIYLDELAAPSLAVSRFEQARAYGLDRLNFTSKLARAYYEAELYLEAADYYERLRERPDIAEDDPALLYNIASAYLGARRLQEADEYLGRAVEQGYEKASIYNQRGLIRELQGDREAAVTNYFQGAERAEETGESLELLNSNLDRFWRNEPPEPLRDWLAPVDSDY